MVKGSEMARAMKELSDAEEVLERMIPPELRPVLKRMADAQITVNGITAEAYFIDGFKTGARFMLAVHDDANGDLYGFLPTETRLFDPME